MRAGKEVQERKVMENRLRRVAKRQGCTVRKSRRRDSRALDYGFYWITNDRNIVEVELRTWDDVLAYVHGDDR